MVQPFLMMQLAQFSGSFAHRRRRSSSSVDAPSVALLNRELKSRVCLKFDLVLCNAVCRVGS
ncbi:hypothetical protein [Lyngbya aestuarii]|uniref:hypothetical protein n=1 Tax=Lyngbya aestuarii TaxID=118322 RepID=UPI00403DD41D